MSFRCENCSEAQESGTKPIRRCVEAREKSYTGGGYGWEIVKEKMLCASCKDKVADASFVRKD